MSTNHDNHQPPIITITCPACGHAMTVADNGWTAIMCTGCGGVIEHTDVNGGGQR